METNIIIDGLSKDELHKQQVILAARILQCSVFELYERADKQEWINAANVNNEVHCQMEDEITHQNLTTLGEHVGESVKTALQEVNNGE